jgi:hypothetical protein
MALANSSSSTIGGRVLGINPTSPSFCTVDCDEFKKRIPLKMTGNANGIGHVSVFLEEPKHGLFITLFANNQMSCKAKHLFTSKRNTFRLEVMHGAFYGLPLSIEIDDTIDKAYEWWQRLRIAYLEETEKYLNPVKSEDELLSIFESHEEIDALKNPDAKLMMVELVRASESGGRAVCG